MYFVFSVLLIYRNTVRNREKTNLEQPDQKEPSEFNENGREKPSSFTSLVEIARPASASLRIQTEEDIVRCDADESLKEERGSVISSRAEYFRKYKYKFSS